MEGKEIFKKIVDIMADIGPIGKNKKNTQQNFKYRGIDDVMNHLQPLFIKHRVFPVVTVTDRKREVRPTKSGGTLTYTVLTMNVTLYAEDGSSVVVTVDGEAMDPGDKSTNKAISIGYKYAMFTLFCIPTDDIIDPDSVTPETTVIDNGNNQVQPVKQPIKQTPPVKQPVNTDATRDATKQEIDTYIENSKHFHLYPADESYAANMIEYGIKYADLCHQIEKIKKQPLQSPKNQEVSDAEKALQAGGFETEIQPGVQNG